MSRFEEYNRLIYGETVGWICGRRVIKDLTSAEYDVLLSLLTHWKSRLRWSAADRLGKIGDPRAIESLTGALQDAHWLVRLHAAKALGRIGQPIAVKSLTDAMNDECPYVRRRIATALRQLNCTTDELAIQALTSALSDPDKGVRACAVRSLDNIASLSAIAAIAAAVCDQDTNVSWRAVETLERIGAPAVPVLINLLDSPDEAIRYRAVKILGKIGNRRAIEPLFEIALIDSDEKVQQRARFALRRFGYQVNWGQRPSRVEKLKQWWKKLWKRTE